MSAQTDANMFKAVASMAVIGGALLVEGIRKFRRKRVVEDLARSKIATAPQGWVEIEGFAFPMNQTGKVACLLNKPCTYYEIVLQKYRKSGKHSKWVDVAKYVHDDPFLICDDTGVITVIPMGIDLEIKSETMGWGEIATEKREEILQKLDVVSSFESLPSVESGFFSGSYRCVEKKILLGAPVLFHGELKSTPQELYPVKDDRLIAFHTRMKSILTNFSRYKALFDKNKDGIIDDDEAKSGFHFAALSGRAQSTSPDFQLKHFGRLVKHPEQASFLADCHGEHLQKRLSAWNSLKILGGLALILGAVYLCLNHS